jgi:hypothetical protein
MGNEQPSRTYEIETVSTRHDGTHESVDDELSLKKSRHYDRKDVEHRMSREDPDNANQNEMGNLSQATPEQDTYISGLRLILVWLPLSIVVFLMLLDISIVATVISPLASLGLAQNLFIDLTRCRPSLGSQAIFIPLRMWVGTVVLIFFPIARSNP